MFLTYTLGVILVLTYPICWMILCLHELSHAAALRYYRVKIYGIYIGTTPTIAPKHTFMGIPLAFGPGLGGGYAWQTDTETGEILTHDGHTVSSREIMHIASAGLCSHVIMIFAALITITFAHISSTITVVLVLSIVLNALALCLNIMSRHPQADGAMIRKCRAYSRKV